MNKFWKVDNFVLNVDEHVLLNDFSLTFLQGQSVCVLGESGTGKSLLLKQLLNMQKQWQTNAKVVFYLGESLPGNNSKDLFDNLDIKWEEFSQEIFRNKKNLTFKYALLTKLLQKPDFFFCEDLHHILNHKEFILFCDFIKEQGITCFYVTNRVEDVVFFDYLFVLKNNQIAIEGRTESVLKEEKLMKLLGFSLPFYVNMSRQLSYYGLLNKICMSKEELEENIWQLK